MTSPWLLLPMGAAAVFAVVVVVMLVGIVVQHARSRDESV